jgi:exonuclease III
MAGNNRHLSILTLNVNGLNTPIKRHGIANWLLKTGPNHMLLIRDSSHRKKETLV